MTVAYSKPSPQKLLSNRQIKAVIALAEGMTQAAAAEFAGTSPQTVTAWMQDPVFHARLEASLSRSCPRSLFEDTSGGQLLASHSASHVSPRLFLLGAALGRGNTARVDRPCQAQQMLRNLRA